MPTVADPFELAERIRTVVAAETGLSCSVGISDNKQRAKVATGFGKPAGVFALTDENWMAVMGDRDVDALWGVGPKTAKRLAGLGITTVADLAATDPDACSPSTFGPTTGLWILLLAKGGGDDERQRRAVGAALAQPRRHASRRTSPNVAEMDSAIDELASQTLAEVVEQDRIVTRVAVTVRTKTFFTRTKIRKLPAPSTDESVDRRHRAGRASTSSNSTARCDCSASGWNWRCRSRAVAVTTDR